MGTITSSYLLPVYWSKESFLTVFEAFIKNDSSIWVTSLRIEAIDWSQLETDWSKGTFSDWNVYSYWCFFSALASTLYKCAFIKAYDLNFFPQWSEQINQPSSWTWSMCFLYWAFFLNWNLFLISNWDKFSVFSKESMQT